MFGQPVHRLLAEMPAAEFRMWAVYRQRRGFAQREQHELLAILTYSFRCANSGKDAPPPDISDFYRPLRQPESGDPRYTAEERKTLKSLMREK